MKILDIGQGLFINPEYIIKIERDKKSIGERVAFTINIYLNYPINYNMKFTQNSNMEVLSFDTQEKRDDYFYYLFNMLNESDNEVINKVSKNDKKY
jgi:hypothetical protein